MSEYFLTNSKYRWLNLSCSQCCDHVEEDELDEEVEEGAALPAFDTWKDRSYLPGGLWPKIITWKKGWKLAKGKDWESVAGLVIQATGMVEFGNSLRTGVLLGGCWCPCGGRTYPRINFNPHWGCRLVLRAVWLS